MYSIYIYILCVLGIDVMGFAMICFFFVWVPHGACGMSVAGGQPWCVCVCKTMIWQALAQTHSHTPTNRPPKPGLISPPFVKIDIDHPNTT